MEGDMEGHVRRFLLSIGEDTSTVDDELIQYIAGVVSEFDDQDTPDGLCDVLAGFSAKFEGMDEDSRLAAVADLLCAAREGAVEQEGQHFAGLGEVGSGLRSAGGASSPGSEGGGGRERSDSGGEASASGEPLGVTEQETVNFLLGMCPPGTGEGIVVHVLRKLSGGDSEAAAVWLLENDVLEAERQRAEAEEREAREAAAELKRKEKERKALVDRFSFQAVRDLPPPGKGKGRENVRMWESKDGAAPPTRRYLEGALVNVRKGEKFITVNEKEEWDGGSRGKVVSKGKRGKGFY